jgi:hypothetical protein
MIGLSLFPRHGESNYERLYAVFSQVVKGIDPKIFFSRTGFWCKDCEYADRYRPWRGH